MRRTLTLLTLILIGCSSGPDFAGGTSSSDNAKVMGIVVSSTSEPVVNTTITIMNGFDSVGVVMSDAQGKFEIALTESDSRILFAQKDGLMGKTTVRGNDNSTVITIKNPGAISIQTDAFSIGDTVRVAGIPYSWVITKQAQSQILSPLPEGPLPPIRVGDVQFTDVVGSVNPDDTLEVAILSNTVKPLWKFPLTVAVNERVIAHYGSLELFRDTLERHIKQVELAFNDAKIAGILQFPIDSIYQFSGSIASQGQGTVAPSAYRWIFSDTNDTRSRSVVRFDYIWSYSKTSAFFTPTQVLKHAALLAEARGAFDLTDIAVPAGTVPVSYPSLTMENSILNGGETSTIDPYTAAVLNYNAGSIGSEREIIHQGQVDSLLIAVVDEKGVPLKNQTVTLYGVKIDEIVPDTIPLATAVTSVDGVAQFAKNPLVDNGKLIHSAVLITSSSGGKSGAEWFTVYQSGLAWFNAKRAVQTTLVIK